MLSILLKISNFFTETPFFLFLEKKKDVFSGTASPEPNPPRIPGSRKTPLGARPRIDPRHKAKQIHAGLSDLLDPFRIRFYLR